MTYCMNCRLQDCNCGYCGPQKQPSSQAKIKAEHAQTISQLVSADCIHLYAESRIALGETGYCVGEHRRCLFCGQQQISVLGEEWKTIIDSQPLHDAVARLQAIIANSQTSVTPPKSY